MKKIDNIFEHLKKSGFIVISVDNFYKEVRDLTGDLIFFKELTSRIKKSKFDFACVPTFNGNIRGTFVKKLWGNAICRGWSLDEETTDLLLKIYYSLNAFFEILDNDCALTADLILMIKDLDEFLVDEFNLSLCNEAGSFIGCSSSCGVVIKKLRGIGLK